MHERTKHDSVEFLELSKSVVESKDLSGADEGEILRPEEDDLPLAGIRLARDVHEGLAGALQALRAALAILSAD